MDLAYIEKEIIPVRKQEISEDKNCATRQPIYFVYDLDEQVFSGWSDYSVRTNLKGVSPKQGYLFDKEGREEAVFVPKSDLGEVDDDEDMIDKVPFIMQHGNQ